MSEFTLPDVGEGLTEAEIVTWRVAVGDTVAINDVLVDIETAKSVVELPSPFEGVVEAIMVSEGQTVEVGTPIISIGEAASAAADRAHAAAEASPSEVDETDSGQGEASGADDGSGAVLVGYGPRATGAPQRRRRRRRADETADTSATTEPTAEIPKGPVLAKPPVRKLAKDLGVDLRDVPASGTTISRADVENFATGGTGNDARSGTGDAAASPSHAAETSTDGDTAVPVRGVRKQMASAMVESAFKAPHVTEWITVDVSESMQLLDRLSCDRRFADVKVTPLTLVARAACLSVRRTPEINASWDGEHVILHGTVNLGLAAATERGLIVPNIPGADSLSFTELAATIGELTETARQGRTQPEQMSGGTFTITNVGVFGVDGGTPIINPGESAILAVGAVNRRPWVNESDEIVPRWVTTLALSFDHRIVDGEQGSRFLTDVGDILRQPSLALTF